MSSVTLLGDTSGSVLLQAPAIAGSTTINIAAQSGTLNVGGPTFYAYASANQGISNGAWTKVTLDVELFDTNNNFANSRFTPTVAGYYQINARIFSDYNSAFSSSVYCGIYKNGTIYSQNAYYNSATSYGFCGFSDIVYCNGSTDYIEMYVFLNGGTSVYIDGGSTSKSGMSGCLIRTA